MKVVYLILAFLLLLCLCHMPYGYYIFVRLMVMCVFAFMAYQKFSYKQEVLALVFIAVAVLFQPFFKIPLGRMMWNVVDVVLAVGLLLMTYKESNLR